ncbi:hypothetical protein MMC07_005751 [Pseudocyphellaria aurata]|nr:hypothetical protein [Pseudocyphellaria aurata]
MSLLCHRGQVKSKKAGDDADDKARSGSWFHRLKFRWKSSDHERETAATHLSSDGTQSVATPATPLTHSVQTSEAQDTKEKILEDKASNEAREPEKSFWEQAAAKLDPKIRDALDEIRNKPDQFRKEARKPDDPRIPSFAQIASDNIRKQMDELDGRAWALPFDIKVKKAKIREVLEKLNKVAKVIKDNGNGLIDCDPTGYAKAAWLPFCILLNIEQNSAALASYASITLLIHQYESVENTYAKRMKDDFFEQSLVEFYAKILTCEVALARYFERNEFVKFLRAIPKVDDWVEKKKEIDHLNSELRSSFHLADSEDLVELVEDSRRQETRHLLDWITEFDTSLRHDIIIGKAKLDTDNQDAGQWLLKDDGFKNWKDLQTEGCKYGVRALWLHGPVGCGKSSLTAQIVEHFLRSASASKLRGEQVAYFYCVKGQLLGSTAVEILRSLVRQLSWCPKDLQIEPAIRACWKDLDSPQPKQKQLSLKDCQDWLLRFAKHSEATTIIIDALDECEERWNLLQALGDLSSCLRDQKISVKLFLSSRDNVRSSLNCIEQLAEINVTSAKTNTDLQNFIQRYVMAECRRFPDLASEENLDLKKRLVDDLTEKGSLAFRWTELQLALFFPRDLDCFNPIDIENRLSGLKDRVGVEDLDNTYKEIYGRVEGQPAKKQDLDLALKWMLACRTRMNINCLIDVIKFNAAPPNNPNQPAKSTSHIHEDYVLVLTSNLLILDDKKVFHFAHASVKEFFESKKGFSEQFPQASANAQVSLDCLNCVLSSDSATLPYGEWDEERVTFRLYSFRHWTFHCSRMRASERQQSPLREPFQRLLLGEPDSSAFQKCILPPCDSIFKQDEKLQVCRSKSHGAFFLACAWGFFEIVDAMLQQNPETINLINYEGMTGLHVAAIYNQVEVIRRILNPKANIKMDVNTPDKDSLTALQYAAMGASSALVAVLLETADICVNFSENDQWPALHFAAAESRHHTVLQLLSHGADVNCVASQETALHVAARFADFKTVKTLLEAPNVNINVTDWAGVTPLMLATASLDESIQKVEAILKFPEVDIKATDSYYGQTALHHAASVGSPDVVKLLLERDAENEIKEDQSLTSGRRTKLCNMQESRGYTPLHEATFRCNGEKEIYRKLKIVEELLKQPDIDTSLKEKNGLTPSHEAIRVQGTLDLVRAFISGEADIKIEELQAALELAQTLEMVEVAEVLKARMEGIKLEMVDDVDTT